MTSSVFIISTIPEHSIPLPVLRFIGVVWLRAPGKLQPLHRQAVAFPNQQKTHKTSDERLKGNRRTAHYQQLFLSHLAIAN
jgi:hypothetical protein